MPTILQRNKKPSPKPQRSSTMWTAEKIKYLSQSEMKKLFSIITSKRDYALFLLGYRHGLRSSEIGMIRIDDIDLDPIPMHGRAFGQNGDAALFLEIV